MKDYQRIKDIIIVRNSSEPLYVQLKEFMKRAIVDGDFRSGECIPSERELCRQLEISHITVRQALSELTMEGFLTRRPGKGTFVAEARSTQGGSVGLVLPDFGSLVSPYFITGLLFGVKRVLQQEGYTLTIFTETETDYLKEEKRGNLKGVILIDPQLRDVRITMLQEQEFLFTVIGTPQHTGIPFVDNDNVATLRELTAACIGEGRSAALLNGPAHWTISEDRENGFRQACEAAGSKCHVMYGRFDESSGYTGALKALSRGVEVLVCGDDRIVVGALKAVRESGLRIPEDVSLGCCNNSDFTEVVTPALTVMDIFPYKIGEAAAHKILAMIAGRPVETATYIRSMLIERESHRKSSGRNFRKSSEKTNYA